MRSMDLKVLNQIKKIYENDKIEFKKIKLYSYLFLFLAIFALLTSIVFKRMWPEMDIARDIPLMLFGFLFAMFFQGKSSMKQWPIIKSVIDKEKLDKLVSDLEDKP